MPLPVFDSIDDVPDAFRDAYEVVDGKAVSKDVAKLQAALAKERAERERVAKEAKEAAARAADLEQSTKARQAGITDDQVAALRAEMAKALEPVQAERDKLASELRTLRLDGAVKSLMASDKVGVRAERIETLWKLIKDEYDLTDSGTPVYKTDPTQDVTKSLASRVKEYPEFFAAPPASGSGAQPSRSGAAAGIDVAKLVDTNPMALLEMAHTKAA